MTKLHLIHNGNPVLKLICLIKGGHNWDNDLTYPTQGFFGKPKAGSYCTTCYRAYASKYQLKEK